MAPQRYIDKLPTELLINIFRLSLARSRSVNPCCNAQTPDNIAAYIRQARPHASSPLNLSQVDRRWRGISLDPSMKDLWSIIIIGEVDGLFNYDKPGRMLAAMVHLHLERSLEAPLTIDASLPKDLINREFLYILIRNARRWRHATLSLHCPTGYWQELLSLDGNLPILEALVFLGGVPQTLGLTERYFVECPRLYSTAFTGNSPRWSDLSLMPRNLQALYTNEAQSEAVVLALQYFTSLHTLFVDSPADASKHRSSLVAVTSQAVRRLSLRQIHKIQSSTKRTVHLNLCSLLQRLTLPQLQYLEFVRPVHAWDQAVVSDFFKRSGCPLQTLDLNRVDISQIDLHRLLQCVPTLTTLSVQHIKRDVVSSKFFSSFEPVEDALFLSLLYDPNSSHQPLLPRLKTFKMVSAFPFCSALFMRMLRSRWCIPSEALVARLESVDVHFKLSMVEPWLPEALRGSKVEGPEITYFLL